MGEEVEEEEWVIKRTHWATLGAESSLVGIFSIVNVKEERIEDEEKN
jgi:hypothetical protein